APLWGNRLMQFQLNGQELDAAKDDSGDPDFEKEFGDDGKGFVPAKSGTYRFEVPKEITDVQFLSFMTAGAENYDMTVHNVRFDVWPEEDLRPRPYLIRYNRLGYLTNQPQPVILEWQEDLNAQELPLTIRQASHGERVETVSRTLVSADAGLAITPIELELSEPDYNTLIIPETVKRTEHTSALVRTRTSLDEYEKQRDLALGAFHWFDMRTYPGAHEQDRQATLYGHDKTLDVYGGWYDAGDYGRYSVNGAWSVMVMLMSYVAAEDAFPAEITPLTRTDAERPALLDLVLPELEFLLKMQRDDGAVYHKVSSRDWPLLTTSPQQDQDARFVMPISSTATADVGAVMNLAAYLFAQTGRDADAEWAERFAQAADRAGDFLANHPERIMVADRYDGAEYGGPYTDSDDSDERLLYAVSRMWRGEPLDVSTYQSLLQRADEPRFGDQTPDWMNVNFLAVFNALMASESPEQSSTLLKVVEQEFSRLLNVQQQDPYGLMIAGTEDEFDWGSNGVIATMGTQLMWLHSLTGEQDYRDAAYRMSHWFFGLNPHGLNFTTGASRFNVRHPHFRPLVSQAAPQPYGLLAGGPNSVALKGDQVAASVSNKAPMQVYVDHQESWATNEVAINWQAAWSSYLALLVNAF
ncbi:glycoside hydrolase family 9 protein, partial [Reinekea blandensis]